MRKSGIEIDEARTSELSALSDNPDEELARRAKIVLLLGEGRSIRSVADELGTDKNTVCKWKRRFLEGGAQALLSGHGGGPAPAVDVGDLREEIRTRIDSKGIEGWTRRTLAEDIGVDESRVGRELGRMGITLERRSTWEYPAPSGAETTCACLAGVYLSATERCVVVCTSDVPIVGGSGSVVTRSRRLAGALSSAGRLTLADALRAAADHAGDPGRKVPRTMASFLADVAGTLPSGPGFGLHAVALAAAPPRWRGTAPLGLTMSAVADAGAWDAAASSLLGQFGPSAVSPVVEGMRAFCGACLAATEPFVWVREVAARPRDTRGERDAPTEAADPLGEALASAVGGATSGDAMDCKMVVVVRGPLGVDYEVVDAPLAFPGTGAFSFSSAGGLMAGINEMEEPMVALRNEAGRSAAEMFVSVAKKNSIRAAPAAR